MYNQISKKKKTNLLSKKGSHSDNLLKQKSSVVGMIMPIYFKDDQENPDRTKQIDKKR